ncbi:MAG: hypothetical protein H0A75_08960 [Candidatus Methanofishera endochildressiae]|uniref:Uncharacterized protein n=1 Tax=Candidatus Methanofishera endochildressiae TaxID=2738884 RepID=A0A7Z0SE49_9GAMM|nr:hypothetical protein [Candidatus Methanofishera endochildressiae]
MYTWVHRWRNGYRASPSAVDRGFIGVVSKYRSPPSGRSWFIGGVSVIVLASSAVDRVHR